MDCSTCFKDYIIKCPDSLKIKAQLTPLVQYTWIIKDKFDSEYSDTFITDENGFWEIPIEDLPAGLLTEYSGDFTLQVLSSECKPIKFKVAQEYDCINFHVRAGTRVKDRLGCDFECVNSDGGSPTNMMIQFEDEDIVTITWNTQLENLFGSSPTIQVYLETSPGVFELSSVSVTINRTAYDEITSIVIDMGGPATGYIILS
jgi:hypothetical protein